MKDHHRPIVSGALSLLLASLAGCVPAARHRDAVAELEKLLRENLELRRDVAEQRVRLEEALEALGIRPPGQAAGSTARALTGGAPAPDARPDPIGGGATPASILPPPDIGEIDEEEIRDAAPPSGAPADEGERTIWVARRYRDEGRMPEAIEAYGRFIREHPFSPLLPEAFLERGRARLRAGDRPGALEDLRTVVEAFPGSPLVREARLEAARLESP